MIIEVTKLGMLAVGYCILGMLALSKGNRYYKTI